MRHVTPTTTYLRADETKLRFGRNGRSNATDLIWIYETINGHEEIYTYVPSRRSFFSFNWGVGEHHIPTTQTTPPVMNLGGGENDWESRIGEGKLSSAQM